MTSGSNLYKDIVRFAVEGCSFDSLPPEVIAISKEVIVNAAAVGLAGAAQEEGHLVTGFVQEMGGNGRCTIIGKGLRTSPVYAALANGLMIHLLDFDDEVVAEGSHPGSVILPVVMALGEMEGIPGSDVLSAFVLGCEVVSKLGGHSPEDAGTGAGDGTFASSIGAAAAAGKLLGLGPDQLEQALYLAAQNSAGGVASPVAGPGRAYRQGQSAMAGLTAAVLAQRGLRASASQVTSGPGGSSFGRPETAMPLPALGDSLGNPFDVLDPGAALKIYPCAAQAHTAIDTALQLIQQYRVTSDEMSSVKLGVAPAALAAMPFPTPGNGWEARYCLSYVVATALVHGHPLIDNFTDSAINDLRTREMMDRVSVESTESPLGSILYPASITVDLKDGRRLQHRAEFARGHAELPLSPEELDAKFLYCSRYILPPDHIEESIVRLRDLENIENTTGIFSVLGG